MNKIPEDVIYNIIFACLRPPSGCSLNEIQLTLVNKRANSDSLRGEGRCPSPLRLGGKKWCPIHNPHECRFSKYLIHRLGLVHNVNRRANRRAYPWTIPPSPTDYLTYHDSNHFYTPSELVYYWTRVLENTPYRVEHLCCGGTGIIFGHQENGSKNISEFLGSK